MTALWAWLNCDDGQAGMVLASLIAAAAGLGASWITRRW
jgi:hypothetical protein